MIYVITAVHNRKNITEKFVMQLLQQEYSDIKLVMVDDGSCDGTSDMVRKLMPSAVIIKGNGNLWWGGALHQAFLWIKNNAHREDKIFISNDDTKFDNSYVKKGVQLLDENPNCLITGCGYSIQTNKMIDGVVHWDFKKGESIDGFKPIDTGNCASTRSLFMDVSTMIKIGGFHPVLLPHYGSDYEWTIRAWKKGINIISFQELSYFFDEETTGDNKLESITFKKIFSKRSNMNPFYKFNMLVLITPPKYLLVNIGHQIQRYFRKLRIMFNLKMRGHKK